MVSDKAQIHVSVKTFLSDSLKSIDSDGTTICHVIIKETYQVNLFSYSLNVHQIRYEDFYSHLSFDTCRTCCILPSLHDKDKLHEHICHNDIPHSNVALTISTMLKKEDIHFHVQNHNLLDLDLLFRCRTACQEYAW